MLKITHIPLLFLGLAGLVAGTCADTIVLNSGERIEATIASETDTLMTIEVQVSPGIIDERVLRKADISKVDRIPADETAFRAVMNLQPGKHSLQPGQYDAILKALERFAAQYPSSAHAAEVQAALAAFQAERLRVGSGEVKLDGRWLTKQEAWQQRVQIGGMQAFNAMKSGDAISALNAFVHLEKNYAGAKVMPDAIQLAQQIMATLKPAAELALGNLKARKAEMDKGFADAGPADRAELKAAYAREQGRAEAALANATAAKLWPPWFPNSEKCLTALLARIATETKRLGDLPVDSMRESIAVAEKAQTEVNGKNIEETMETLAEVVRLWPANDLAIGLRARLAELKAPPKLNPRTTPAPATPAATPVAAATPVVKPQVPASSPVAAPNGTPATAPTPRHAMPEPEGKPFFMSLGGAITIVVLLALILAGANIFNHFRQRADETQD